MERSTYFLSKRCVSCGESSYHSARLTTKLILMPLAELPWGYSCATGDGTHKIDLLLDVSADFLAPQMVKTLHLLGRHDNHDLLRGDRGFLDLLHDT